MDVHPSACPESSVDVDEAIRRARADFQEMPGLRLTPDQARRLWRLDPSTCATVLTTLVASGFLSRSGNGAFVAR
jgi:hypothetical protein